MLKVEAESPSEPNPIKSKTHPCRWLYANNQVRDSTQRWQDG